MTQKLVTNSNYFEIKNDLLFVTDGTVLKLNMVDDALTSLRFSAFSDASAFESAAVFMGFASFGLHGIILKAPPG